MKIKCPNCGKIQNIPDIYVNIKTVKCVKCKAEIPLTPSKSSFPKKPVLTGSAVFFGFFVLIIILAIAYLRFITGYSATEQKKYNREVEKSIPQGPKKPALSPKPTYSHSQASRQEYEELQKTKALKYTVVEKEDVSYPGTPRMVLRVVVKTNRIPSEAQLNDIAISLWRNGNKHWKEFTVFMYLPYMDTHSIAYGIGEFRPEGLKEFKINDYAIDLQKELTSKRN
jgi:hypothetical protein